jgi:MarR family transcriptional regulator for hemolysin
MLYIPNAMTTPLEQHPGYLLYVIARLFRHVFGARLHDLGLSESHWRALGSINKFPGISQTQLATLLGINKAPLGKLIDSLEQDQLVQRAPDPNDRRQKQLRLSERATPVVDTLRQRYEDLLPAVASGLNSDELDTLHVLLQTVYLNLQAIDDCEVPLSISGLSLMHLITGISRLNTRLFDLQLKQLGFTRGQWMIMAAVNRYQGTQQQDLARKLHMQKTALGLQVDELERGGWVERRIDSSDRRARLLYPSNACAAQLRDLANAFEHIHEQSLQGTTSPERALLSQHLDILHQNLQDLAGGAIANTTGDSA